MGKPYKQEGKWYRFVVVKDGRLQSYEGTIKGIKTFKPDVILDKWHKEKYTETDENDTNTI